MLNPTEEYQIVDELLRKLKAKELSKIGIDEVRQAIASHFKDLNKNQIYHLEERILKKLIMKVG